MTTKTAISQPNEEAKKQRIDDESRDGVIARRNVLAGLWAARLMGLPERAARAYAANLRVAHCGAAGDDIVVNKLCADLNRAGLLATPHMIRNKLAQLRHETGARSAAAD